MLGFMYLKNKEKVAKLKIRLGHIFSGDLERKDKLFTRMGFIKAGSVFVEA